MGRAKNLFLLIIEGISFGSLGGLFAWVAIFLWFEIEQYIFHFHYPSSGFDFNIPHPLKQINFPFLIWALFTSFVLGKLWIKLLKKQNLQWFYNVIFFIISTILIHSYITYLNIQSMSYEFNYENIVSMGDLQLNAQIIIFSIFYSIFFQIIKTRLFLKSKAMI